MAIIHNKNGQPEQPIIVAPRRIIRRDLDPRISYLSGQSGITLNKLQEQISAAAQGESGDPMTLLIEAIKGNTDIDIRLRSIGLGFYGFSYTLTANVPQRIITPQKKPTTYIILNPSEQATIANPITFFASAARAAGAYTSSAFDVSNVNRLACFLDVTVNGGGGTLSVNLQSRDPLSGNWATVQTDIFSGSAAVGTYYANVGVQGVDQQVRLVATVGVAPITFSIAGYMKDAVSSATGSTLYLGGPDVTDDFGFPLLFGNSVTWNLMDNVELFAVAASALTVKVFQMQGA